MPAIRSFATPRRRSHAARALGFSFALCLLMPSTALAQAPSKAAAAQADAAFEEARELLEQGRFKEACDKFDLSMRLDPSTGTLLNLANCYEAQGDLLHALETFELGLSQAQSNPDRKRRQVWSEAAKERIESLSPRIPFLSVEGAEPGSQVLLDGKPLEPLDRPVRYNPGRYHLEVSAPGKRPFIQVFELPEGQTLRIPVPPLEAEVVTPAAPAAALTSPPPAPRDERRFGNWPWIAGGTGAALLGTSLVTGLIASSKAGQLEDECPSKVDCDPSLASVKDSAHTLGVTTDVLWIGGALILGTGVTLFVLDHGKSESSEVQAGCFDGGCGFRANGSF